MDIKNLFLREASLQEHVDAQQAHYAEYAGMLFLLVAQGVELSHASKSRVLAACWVRRDYEIAEFLLDKPAWSLPEVLRALKLLDTKRQIRALQKRLTRLEEQGSARPATLGQIRSSIHDLQQEEVDTSLSGALAKRVRRWVQRIPANKLAFYALSMPPEPWRELADLLHLSANDFQLDWFLPVIFGEEAPAGSMAAACLQAREEDLGALIQKWQAPYSFLRRTFQVPLAEELRQDIARYEELDTLLWYYEELACPAVDEIIEGRLHKGETPEFGYGMLVERMLQFEKMGASFYKALIPIAEKRLHSLKLPMESPVVVLGDASASMDVAIRVATIIGSLLAALTGAEIRFFNGELISMKDILKGSDKGLLQRAREIFQGEQSKEESFVPRGLEDVMTLVRRVRASGSTSPAAALWPSFRDREVVRHFIVVTDEEENTPHSPGAKRKSLYYFSELLKKYREEVYPARVAFVSFLRNPQKPGMMTPRLDEYHIPYLCFPMNGRRPDLTKLDALLGLLASESAFFQEQADLLAQEIDSKGLDVVMGDLEEHTHRDESAILLFQIGALRDLAFSRVQDRQGFLGLLGKTRHLARIAGYDQLEEGVSPLLATIAGEDNSAPISSPFYEQLLQQVERWELLLQRKR